MGIINKVEGRIARIKQMKISNPEKVKLLERLKGIKINARCAGCKAKASAQKRLISQMVNYTINKLL